MFLIFDPCQLLFEGWGMELTVEHLQNGIKKVGLRGKLDIPGTEQIALRLAAETSAEKGFIVVDLSELEFLTSVGMGALIKNFRALRLRGGNMVLLNPQKVVDLILATTRVNNVIPVYYDLKTACERVKTNEQSNRNNRKN